MSVKTKIVILIAVAAFLGALVMLVSFCLKLSGFIDSNIAAGYLLVHKTASLWSFLIMGIIVTVVILGITVPLGLVVAGRVSEPVDKMLDNAHYDILTGAYNRRYVDENLKNLIGFLSRSGGGLSLLMIDIDHFKEYNEKYGYGKGDNCLKIVANILAKGISRSEDFTARYGGKEFVVVLPNTDENGVCIIAEKLLATIRECKIPNEENDPAGCVTVSIGVATGKIDHLQSGDDYIKRANEMMHKSVREGRNRYSITKL